MTPIKFKKAIEVLDYEIVEYIKGYNYRSAFATEKSTGKLYYFHIEDLRDTAPMVYRRTAESTKDFHGGTNLFDVNDKLAMKGYTIVEPRIACDYNSM